MLLSHIFFKYLFFKFVKGGAFFLFLRSRTVINRTALNLVIGLNHYSEFFIFTKYSSFLSFNQAIDQFAFKNSITQLMLLINVLFITTSSMYCFVSTLWHLEREQRRVVDSLESLFFNFWWMEREVSEMHGLKFINKFDLRNLLLEYSSFFAPLDRLFPSAGFFELFYMILRGVICSTQLTVQI